MSSTTASKEEIEALLNSFPRKDADQRPLLKATSDMKFTSIHIEANHNGLLDLAEAALKAARDTPAKHPLSIDRVEGKAGESPLFEIARITRNERLVYKEVIFDGKSNMAVVAPLTLSERFLIASIYGVLMLLLLLVAIGGWTLIQWIGGLF